MLIPISQLPPDDYLQAIMIGSLVAIDPETGAKLKISLGRTSGAQKYILILPLLTVAERGGLFAPADFSPRERKRFRAETTAEAIEIANAKLVKLLKARTACAPSP